LRVYRIALHSFVLLFANFAGIWVGFLAYHFAKPANQIAIQLPIAVILSVVLFLIWSRLIRFVPFLKSLVLCDWVELIGTLIASLVWAPAIFVPLHYLTQGYLTGAGNTIVMLLFQLPVNLFAIVVITIFHQSPTYDRQRAI